MSELHELAKRIERLEILLEALASAVLELSVRLEQPTYVPSMGVAVS